MRSSVRLCALAAVSLAGCLYDWDSIRDASVARDAAGRDAARDVVAVDREVPREDVAQDRAGEVDAVDVVAVTDVTIATDVMDARADVTDASDVVDVTDARGDVMDVFDAADARGDVMDVPQDRATDVTDVVDVTTDRGADVFDTGTDTGPSCVGVMCPCVPGNPSGWCHPGETCAASGCVTSASGVAGSLLITEIMYDPVRVADATGEWFEIHNPSATTAINLERVRVTSENDSLSVVLPAGLRVIVPPMGHVVFARSSVASENGSLPSVAYAYGANLALGNSSDFLQLDLQPGATLIHRVAYNNTMGWPRGMGRSMSLRPTAYNVTASALATGWCDAAMTTQWATMSDYGTPGAINVCP